jgi:hypothetical protein
MAPSAPGKLLLMRYYDFIDCAVREGKKLSMQPRGLAAGATGLARLGAAWAGHGASARLLLDFIYYRSVCVFGV